MQTIKPSRAHLSSLLLLTLLSLWVVLRMFKMPSAEPVYTLRTATPLGGPILTAVPGVGGAGAPLSTAVAAGSIPVGHAPPQTHVLNCTEEVEAAVRDATAAARQVQPAACPPPAPRPACPPAPCAAPAPCPSIVGGSVNLALGKAPAFPCPEVTCMDQSPRLLPPMSGLPFYNPRDLPTCVNAPPMMKRPAPAVPAGVPPGVAETIKVGPLPTRTVMPPHTGRTEYQCLQSSDWAEICHYNLLCTDGDRAVFIDDSQPEGTKVGAGCWAAGHPWV
jgi:hypothetical protein